MHAPIKTLISSGDTLAHQKRCFMLAEVPQRLHNTGSHGYFGLQIGDVLLHHVQLLTTSTEFPIHLNSTSEVGWSLVNLEINMSLIESRQSVALLSWTNRSTSPHNDRPCP